MAADFLTQEEADLMIAQVLGIDLPVDEADHADTPGVLKAYDIGRQERIVRGRMPTLEIINERFGRHLKVGLFGFMRKNAEITVGSVKVQKYADFIRNLAVPTNINIVNLDPFKGNALFIFEPSLIDTIVDSLFGGKNQIKSKIEGRDFTETEQRIISRMLETVFEQYSRSWAPVFEIKPEYLRSEMHTQFANIANPSEVVVSTSFNIEIGSSGGAFHICFPYSSIEPVREILYSSMQGDQVEPDGRWRGTLEEQTQLVNVQMVAEIAAVDVPLKLIAEMQVGDLIEMDIPDYISATVHDVPVARCRYGKSGTRYALRIEEVFADSQSSTRSLTK